MIQHTSIRHPHSTLGVMRPTQSDGPEEWGQWSNRKHYSLEIVQHPSRARMCGFGDKDRRPLAPAAVAKMIVRREDNSLVDIDDVDISFFLVTVDLWSYDGKNEMNLVLHPSSTDRYIPSTLPGKQRKREKSNVASTTRPAQASGTNPGPSHLREAPTPIIPPSNPGYPFPPPPPPTFPDVSVPFPPPTWGYTPQQPVDRNTTYPPPVLPSIHTFGRTSSSGSEAQGDAWHHDNGTDVYRSWHPEPNYSASENYSAQSADPSSRPSPERREGWSHNEGFPASTVQPPTPSSPNQILDSSSPIYASPSSSYPQQSPFFQQPSYSQTVPPPSSMPPRHTYTRTLVGPLSANATRLLDEHRKPGIFFLFQDLSVRTEGTFRLRLRLMNVGAHPAPEAGAKHVHTEVSPVLAQSFTEPFTVYSAKRFPGVPDTTALSIAFGNQGQKLPLRNRHGSGKRRRRDDSGSDDDSDGD